MRGGNGQGYLMGGSETNFEDTDTLNGADQGALSASANLPGREGGPLPSNVDTVLTLDYNSPVMQAYEFTAGVFACL